MLLREFVDSRAGDAPLGSGRRHPLPPASFFLVKVGSALGDDFRLGADFDLTVQLLLLFVFHSLSEGLSHLLHKDGFRRVCSALVDFHFNNY